MLRQIKECSSGTLSSIKNNTHKKKRDTFEPIVGYALIRVRTRREDL